MNEGWIVMGICVIVVLGAALPLISKRGREHDTPLPPPKETLHDWRKGE